MQSSMSSLYEPKTKTPKVNINVRITVAVKDQLEAVGRLWRALARSRGDDDEIEFSDVVRRILRTGAAQAFAEFGIDAVPTTEEEWAKVERAIAEARTATEKKSRR